MTDRMARLTTGPGRRLVRFRRSDYTYAYRLDDGLEVDTVTTIIGASVPKGDGLIEWAARKAAAYAVDNLDLRERMGRDQFVDLVSRSWRGERGAAADLGTRAHDAAALLLTGEDVDVDPDVRPLAAQIVDFLDVWQVREELSEVTVVNRRHRYAGTLDLVARLGDGRRWLLDYKTGAGVYPEVALQLAAYRNAERYLTDDGEAPMPGIDACGVVWVRPDTWELVPVEAGADVFAAFLHCQHVAQFTRRRGKRVIGDALDRPERVTA